VERKLNGSKWKYFTFGFNSLWLAFLGKTPFLISLINLFAFFAVFDI